MMDEDLQNFMSFWIAGLLKGLESVDKPAQETILRACGKGCADSYTAHVFCDAKQQSADIETFLTNLAQRFPDARYELINPREIRVTVARCACDLVQRGFVRSPIICRCSAYNLQANFERALQIPAEVTLRSSILGDAETCEFVVSFQDNIESSF
jgi:hypothetical protein